MGPPPQPFKFPAPSQHQPRMPTNTQRMFAAPPPNYNPRSNIFRLPPRNNPPQGPQPMSGVQRFIPRQLPLNNNSQSNYFKPREMNINECATYDDSYYGYCYEPEYNYYTDYYNTELDPGFSHDFNYFNTTSDENFCDSQKQIEIGDQDQQDFREVSTSQKPK